MWSRNNQAGIERKQRKLDAGLMSEHFPGVAGIVINMIYRQKGVANPIQRTINFFPGSHAFFRLECLSRDCVDGGFDMGWIINAMIRNHSEVSKGELDCLDNGSRPDHAHIVYEVAIKYA